MAEQTYFSIPQKRILGIDTPDSKPQRVRTINRGELLRMAHYPVDTSNQDILKTLNNVLILGGVSPGTILYKMGVMPVGNAMGSNLQLTWYVYGKNEDSYDELKELFQSKPNLAVGAYKEIIHPNFSFKTLYELSKADTDVFLKHKNDSTWYLGIKVTTAFSAGANDDPPTSLLFDITYCEGTPSEMPLEDRGV